MYKKAQKAPRLQEILTLLNQTYPRAECALYHRNAFELLIATILSAQCTDVRVNLVTPELFAAYPTAAALAAAHAAEVENFIKSINFFRNKTKSLLGMARLLQQEFNGQVPANMQDLLRLPGVARKTANVVLGVAFGIAEGVVVDTHVTRLSQRLGLTQHTDAKHIEQDLMQLLPQHIWIQFSHQLILHGRQICVARTPKCSQCVLHHVCPAAS